MNCKQRIYIYIERERATEINKTTVEKRRPPCVLPQSVMVGNGGGDGEGSQQRRNQISGVRERRSSADPLVIVCRSFSVVTGITAFLCVLVNVVAAYRSFNKGWDIVDGIFRCYAVVIAVVVVIIETEWGFIFKFCKVLEYWVGRGMLQIFVAVMTRAFPDLTGQRSGLVLLQDITSYLLLGCGVTYVISGLLCIGFLKRARQSEEITREQTFKDLEELERRKEELQALLIIAERT